MRLYFATKDLLRDGRSFEGFPLLLEDDCNVAEPAQTYLWKVLTEDGGVTSRLTWEHYGRWLFDYFQFLQSNGLRWDQPSGPRAGSPLARYRQWALEEVGSSRRTVNLYTGVVRRFYRWAFEAGYIDHSPITYRQTKAPTNVGLLAHLEQPVKAKATSSVKEHREPPAFLTMAQVLCCRRELRNESHRLLFELMVQVGLRSCEARTFPLSYVFNPRLREDLKDTLRGVVPVRLRPSDMRIKYDKPRVVHVPVALMERLNAYAIHKRSGIAARSLDGTTRPELLLNANGYPFQKDAVIDVFERLTGSVGFRVRAHALRHTYATHVLRALRKNSDFKGEPLLYVRDRLGHSNVQTTSIYLHLLNQLEAELVFAHEDYVDDLFARSSA